MIEKDKDGEWDVSQYSACKVRLLTKPSLNFLTSQEAIGAPIIQRRDILAEFDALKVKLEKAGIAI